MDCNDPFKKDTRLSRFYRAFDWSEHFDEVRMNRSLLKFDFKIHHKY